VNKDFARAARADHANPRRPVSTANLDASTMTGDEDIPAITGPAAAGDERNSTELDGADSPATMRKTPALWRNWQTQRIQNPGTTIENYGEDTVLPYCCPAAAQYHPDLLLIVEAWDALPAEVRATIAGIVRSWMK
jgi:hypothetical protein